MSSIFKKTVLLFCFSFTFWNSSFAQFGDLYIYGFSQAIYNDKFINYEIKPQPQLGIPSNIVNKFETASFAQHQTNLFIQKPISEKMTYFMNLEFTGTYSTQFQSGNLNLQEAWVNYRFNEHLEAKVGVLLTTFNNLNEISNRLPLFPYLIRPPIYEELFRTLFNHEDYRPQHSFLQLSGAYNLNETLLLDYSAHLGNNESSYWSTIEPGEGATTDESSGTLWKGENLTTRLAYGFRIGLRDIYENFKIGVSATRDDDNKQEITTNSLSRLPWQTLPILGDVPRYRIGYDFSFRWKKVQFETEGIYVFHDYTDIYKTPVYKAVNLNIDKLFFYENITYNWTDTFYQYSMFSMQFDNSFNHLQSDAPDGQGLFAFSNGFGYRPFDSIGFKAQYLYGFVGQNKHIDIEIHFITLGMSVIF